MNDLYSTHDFEDKYTYTGSDLGFLWTPYKTRFRLWAPIASDVSVCLYRSGDMQTAWAWANWLLVSFLEHAEEHGYGEAVARAIFIAASIWHDSADKIAPTTEGNIPADPFSTDDLRREDMAAWTDYGLNLMQTIVLEECRTDLIRDMRELTAI